MNVIDQVQLISGVQESLIFDFANNCDKFNIYDKRAKHGLLKKNLSHIRNKEKRSIEKLLELVTVKDYTLNIDEFFNQIRYRINETQQKYLKENALKKNISELSEDTGIPSETIRGFFDNNSIEYKKEKQRHDYSYVDKHYKDETAKNLSYHTGIPKYAVYVRIRKLKKEEEDGREPNN